METKQAIRKIVLAKRNELTKEERREKSERITKEILGMKRFQEAEELLCYASYKSEVETDSLATTSLELGKRLYYPVVTGTELQFYRVYQLSDLKEGYQGIREPFVRKELFTLKKKDTFAFMVVPGCGFDGKNYRIGYGKGFYDRYLAKYPMIYTTMAAFSCQKVEDVFPEPHDVPMNTIITEDWILKKEPKK